MRILAAFVLIAMHVSCSFPGTRAPGDPFGYNRPEELMTICHYDGAGDVEGETMMFNRSHAKWHLRNHQFDRATACWAGLT